MQYLREQGDRIVQFLQRVKDSRHFSQTLRRRLVETSPLTEPGVTRENPGLFSESGTRLFESPQPQHIAALQAADSRIEYFRFRLPTSEPQQWNVSEEARATYPESDAKLSFYDHLNSIGVAGNLFANDIVIPRLTERLRERFGNFDMIGLRGTACVVDLSRGVINPHTGKKLNTPLDIVNEGIETGGNYAPMTGFYPKDRREYAEIGHRTVQWVMEHPQQLRKSMREAGYAEDDIASVFPLLIVYDRSRFPEGSTTLPKDPDEREKCILAAFVLDYPLSAHEVSAQTHQTFA